MNDGWLSVRPAIDDDQADTLGPEQTLFSGPSQGSPAAPGDKLRTRLPQITIDFGEHDPRPITASGAEIVADLEVIDTLGEGGMGVVLLARQHALAREVAVKTIKPDASEVARQALLSEGTISGGLEHPGIVPTHAMGMDRQGRPVLVLKRVEGVSWDALLADPQHGAWADWAGTTDEPLIGNLEILMQVCNAVEFAHSRGVLHRDIKPHNVLIGRYGDVYLSDWGIAKRLDRIRDAEPFAGTPVYAAPEMVSGKGLSACSDVYLLGATLHHILVGDARHSCGSAREAMARAVLSKPYDYPAEIPRELAEIANRATACDPAERPQSAAALRRALADFLHHRSSTQLAQTAIERLAEVERWSARLRDESDDEQDVEQVAQLDERVAEARFGLTQALQLWDGNQPAREALTRLDLLLAERRERTAQLERMARDLDPQRSRRQRVVLYVLLGLVTLGLSSLGTKRALSGQLWTSLELVQHSVGGMVLFGVASLVWRRQLTRTLFNRRAAQLLLAMFMLQTVARVLGWLGEVPPMQMLVHDCILLAAFASAASMLLSPRFWAMAAIMLATGFVCQLWPAYAMLAFSLSTLSCGVISIVVLTRAQRPG